MAQIHDFATLTALTYAVTQMKEKLVMDFAYHRITMAQFNEKYNALDQQIDTLHFRYIAKNRIVESVLDNLQWHELIHFSCN